VIIANRNLERKEKLMSFFLFHLSEEISDYTDIESDAISSRQQI
jgi:hypothetical protein